MSFRLVIFRIFAFLIFGLLSSPAISSQLLDLPPLPTHLFYVSNSTGNTVGCSNATSACTFASALALSVGFAGDTALVLTCGMYVDYEYTLSNAVDIISIEALSNSSSDCVVFTGATSFLIDLSGLNEFIRFIGVSATELIATFELALFSLDFAADPSATLELWGVHVFNSIEDLDVSPEMDVNVVAGWWSSLGNVLVSQCVFENWKANQAVVYVDEASGWLRIENSTFRKIRMTDSAFSPVVAYGVPGNFAIRDSVFEGCEGATSGGCVYFESTLGDTELEIVNCTFRNSVADNLGGAVYVNRPLNFVAENSHFVDNSAGVGGGSIYVFLGSAARIVGPNCLFETSLSFLDTPPGGGAIGVFGTDTFFVDSCVFRDFNVSSSGTLDGGAIWVSQVGEIHVNHSEFHDNIVSSEGEGGSIYAEDGNRFLVSECFFSSQTVIFEETGIFVKKGGHLSIFQFDEVLVLNTVSEHARAILGGCSSFANIGHLQVDNSSSSSCEASFGGAMVIFDSDFVDVSDCHFVDCVGEMEAGALQVENSIFVSIESSIFDGNFAGNGGAILLLANDAIQLTLCHFSDNMATESGGAIRIDGDPETSMAVVDRCEFRGNKVPTTEFAGALLLRNLHNATVSDSEFEGNSAKSGSSLYSQNVELVQIQNMYVHDEVASDSVIYMITSELIQIVRLRVHDVVGRTRIFRNKKVEIDGVEMKNCRFAGSESYTGGLFFSQNYETDSSNLAFEKGVEIRNSRFEDMIGFLGGAICARISNRIQIMNCSFENCSALIGGAYYSEGVLHHVTVTGTEEFTTFFHGNVISNSTFVNCKSEFEGGAVYAGGLRNCLKVEDSTFFGGTSTRGTHIFVLSSTWVNLLNTEFRNGFASEGGAVYLSSSFYVLLDSVRFVNCRTECLHGDRGTIQISRSTFDQCGDRSIVLVGLEKDDRFENVVEDCTVQGGTSGSLSGSGIVLQSITPNSLSLRRVVLFNNSADSACGGGLFIDASVGVQLSDVTWTQNSAMYGGGVCLRSSTIVLNGVNSLVDNSADIAGGSVFDDSGSHASLSTVDYDGFDVVSSEAGFFGSDFASAPSLWQFVSWKPFGDEEPTTTLPIAVFAGQVFEIVLMVIDEFAQPMTDYPGFEAEISLAANSTSLLQTFEYVANLRQEPELSFRDLSVLELALNLSESAVSPASAGVEVDYLVIRSEDVGEDLVLPLRIMSCPPGFRIEYAELSESHYQSCVICDPAFYSVVPDSIECHACPANANCSIPGIIVSDPDYWAYSDSATGLVTVTFCDKGHCLGANLCDKYFDPDLPLCSACLEGRSEWNGRCVRCTVTSPVLIVGWVVFLLFMLVFLHFSSQNVQSGVEKVYFFFAQTWGHNLRTVSWSAVVATIFSMRADTAMEIAQATVSTDFVDEILTCPFHRTSLQAMLFATFEPVFFGLILAGCALIVLIIRALVRLLCPNCCRNCCRKTTDGALDAVGVVAEEVGESSSEKQDALATEKRNSRENVKEDNGDFESVESLGEERQESKVKKVGNAEALGSESSDMPSDLVSTDIEDVPPLKERITTFCNTVNCKCFFGRIWLLLSGKLRFFIVPSAYALTLLNILTITFSSYVEIGIGFLGCQRFGDSWRMKAYSDVVCWSRDYWLYGIAFMFVLVYVALFPLGLFVFLTCSRKRMDNERFSQTFGTLYSHYREGYVRYWYEPWALVRRTLIFGLTGLAPVLYLSSDQVDLLICLFLLLILLIHLIVNPFYNRLENILEGVSLSTLLAVQIIKCSSVFRTSLAAAFLIVIFVPTFVIITYSHIKATFQIIQTIETAILSGCATCLRRQITRKCRRCIWRRRHALHRRVRNLKQLDDGMHSEFPELSVDERPAVGLFRRNRRRQRRKPPPQQQVEDREMREEEFDIVVVKQHSKRERKKEPRTGAGGGFETQTEIDVVGIIQHEE